MFIEDKLDSINFNVYDKQKSELIKEEHFSCTVKIDEKSGLVSSQTFIDKYIFTTPDNKEHQIEKTYDATLLKQVPKKRNTDIIFVFLGTPMSTYLVFKRLHDKYYIPEMFDIEIPHYMQEMYKMQNSHH